MFNGRDRRFSWIEKRLCSAIRRHESRKFAESSLKMARSGNYKENLILPESNLPFLKRSLPSVEGSSGKAEAPSRGIELLFQPRRRALRVRSSLQLLHRIANFAAARIRTSNSNSARSAETEFTAGELFNTCARPAHSCARTCATHTRAITHRRNSSGQRDLARRTVPEQEIIREKILKRNDGDAGGSRR